MQSNIFKATNEGKGLILLPHDNGEHPIVGACISPRENALDTIQLPGSTLPDWVADARTAANYDSTLDTMLPPDITHESTQTFALRPYEVEAFGGYNLKVNGVVCPMHFTQGILRNNGKCLQTLKQRTVTVDTYSFHPEYLATKGYWYAEARASSSGAITNTKKNLFYALAKIIPECDAISFGYEEITLPDQDVRTYIDDSLVVVKVPVEPNTHVVPTTFKHRYYVASYWYTYNLARVQNSIIAANQVQFETNGDVSSLMPRRSLRPNSNYNRYHIRYDAKYYISLYHFTDEYEDISATKSYQISNLKTTPNSATLLHINSGLLNTGVDYGSTGSTTGIVSYTDTLKRDTTKGFMVGTNKAVVVTNELRRNFLRVSPTVFSHKGGF